jgi:Holliday junction resolvasome RuvABC endonuclease subunit
MTLKTESIFFPNVFGLDLSLRAPGLAVVSGNPRNHVGDGLEVDSALIRIGEDVRGPQRLSVVSHAVWDWMKSRGAKAGSLVVQEGYGFSSQMAHSTGELGGCVRRDLYENGCNLVVIPPSTLKRWVTGKGNDDKNVVIKKAFQRWGFDVDEDNQCDAFTCAMLGLVDVSDRYHWTQVELDILTKKVERYAGQGQASWLGGSPSGKVPTRTRKRKTGGGVDLGSSVLKQDVQGPRRRRRHDSGRSPAA